MVKLAVRSGEQRLYRDPEANPMAQDMCEAAEELETGWSQFN